MIHYPLDVFSCDRAAAFLQARLAQIEMREAAEARFFKCAAGTGFRTTIDEQDAICEIRVEENVGVARADTGKA